MTDKVNSTAYIADPVDISSGNFAFSHNDLVIPTAGVPLIIKRTYNSLEPIRGWKFNLISTMDISDINNIQVVWNGGEARDVFVRAKKGWVSLYTTDTLATEAGAYVITKSSGIKYRFDTQGRLIGITNKQNLGLVFEYGYGSIEVKDSFGNVLASVVFNGSGQIESITDSAGNTITYTYDGSNLTAYTNRNGAKETYEYTDGLLTRIIGPDNAAYVTNTYDDQGRVVSQLDSRGNETTFVYSGELEKMVVDQTTVTYPDGISRVHKFHLLKPTAIEGSGMNVAFQYDANNKVKAITDPNGKTWEYQHNSAGQVTQTSDPAGNKSSVKYDTQGNPISVTNALGQTVTFEYDASNNLIKTTNADGKTTAYEYNTNNQLIKMTNALGQSIVNTYNSRGQLETRTLPNGATTTYHYNALGNVESITDALGREIRYEYDKEGKVTAITDPLGNKTTMEYNGYGDLIRITDPKDRNTTMEYNTDGLLTKTTFPDGTTVQKTYDVMGRVLSVTDTLGRTSSREYNDLGQVSKIIDPKGNEFLLEYDKVGNVVKVTDAKGNETETTYDELYRPFKTIDANGVEVSTTSYNALSMPTKVEDATGKTVEFAYDGLNRLQSSTLSGAIKAEALYDALGRITQTNDPKGASNTYTYDAMGHLAKETNPLGKETLYRYDIAGRVTSMVTPNGVTSTFVYDDLDRVVTLSLSKGTHESNTTYTYDAVGNVLTVSDEKGTITYTYNINDQVTTRTDIYGNTVSYGYDQAGRLATLTYPDGKAVNYTYDENNNLIKVTDWAGRVTSYEYDANSNLTKASYINGAYTLYSYDTNNRLTSLKNYDKNDQLISANELTRNEIGNITGNKATSPAAIDLSKIKNFNFEVNAFNQITSSDEGDFTYDDNGNLLSYTYDGKEITLEYDLSDRLIKATVGSEVYTYTYDAEGNRVAVNDTRYLVDNVTGLSKPLAELDDGNSVTQYYIWTNGLGYTVDTADTINLYLYDYQGSTTSVLDMDNKQLASYRYTSYGAVISAENDFETPFKYLSQHGIMSDSSALYYVRARYYSPQLSRWTQADLKRGGVANPLSLNRYVLNEGDGVNYVDVSGYSRGNTSSAYSKFKSVFGKFKNIFGKVTDVYTISNIKGATRTEGAINAMILKNFDVTHEIAKINKFAKNSSKNFSGVSLGNSEGVSKMMKVSDALGAIGTGLTWGEEAIVAGKEYGNILASNDDGLTKAAKISASTSGMTIRTLAKLSTGTLKGTNWIIDKTRYINPSYYLMGKEEFGKTINDTNNFLDKMNRTADEIYSGDSIYNFFSH